MTPNQLPPLPEPFALSVSVHDGDTPAKTYVECLLYQNHPNEKQRLYTADQMHAYALAALAHQAQPVHQFRRQLCADWYDGHPDHEDGGGPYETRILYTTPPAPQPAKCLTCSGHGEIGGHMPDGSGHGEPCPDCNAPQPAPVDERDAEIAELRADVLAWRKQCDRLTHQVICCGVAASHPDATLTTRGAYAGKWNSGQAEEVRKLRAERDALAELQSPAPQTKGQP